MTTAEIIKNGKISRFISYRDGHFIYKTDSGFEFSIPMEDLGKATLLAEEKTILLMRYIRKQVELLDNK